MKYINSFFLMVFIVQLSFGQVPKRIADINPGNGDSFEWGLYQAVIEYNGKLFFAANDGTHGVELWCYDGNNTFLVKDINPGSESSKCQNFHIVQGNLLFTAEHKDYGIEIWKSDGTENGTTLVKDLAPGTISGTSHCCTNETFRSFIVYNNELYFSAGTTNFERKLYKTDGTENGTILVKELNHTQRTAQRFLEFNGELYFSVFAEGFWKTDGTPDGTVVIKNDDDFEPHFLYDMGSYMLMVDGYDWNVWRSDGTYNGTKMVKKMVRPNAQSNQEEYFQRYGDIALFTGADDTHGAELWRTDGTEQGTYMIKDVETDPGFIPIYPKNLVAHKELVYYVGGYDEVGDQLFSTDGTESGTNMVINLDDLINGQVYFQTEFTEGTKYLFFTAGNAFNRELWVSDGTAHGTFEISINDNGESTPERYYVYQNKFFFFANDNGFGKEPYIIDLDEFIIDMDNDGFESCEDCDDSDPNIHPDAEEIPNNGIDEDCNGMDLTTGIHELLNSKISIYPNPVTSILNIEIDGNIDYTVTIFDLNGRQVLKAKNKIIIDVSSLSKGTYLLELKDLKSDSKIIDKIVIGK